MNATVPQPYRSYASYLRERFGGAVRKVPINAGFSCPNLDGTTGREGCAFCANRAFSPAVDNAGSPVEQLEAALHRGWGRKAVGCLAYLQPYSNTYGPASRLRGICEPLPAIPGVVGIVVGTRPDCLPEEILDYLAELAERTYVSVELGLQSSHDATLKLHNRGHGYREFEDAVKALAGRGIESSTHVILGLRGETAPMMMETARRLSRLPVSGVKIHQLMILRGTLVHRWFEQGRIEPFSLEDYAQRVAGFISLLRPDQVVHRIMADARPERGLVAPGWSADKAGSVSLLRAYFRDSGLVQGSRYEPDG